VQRDLLLPERARLVHIGPHKTGTTAIQTAMHRARDELARNGVYYPAGGPRRRRAGWALGLPGRRAGTEAPPIARWNRLAREVQAAGDMRVCVSNEDFGRASPEIARKIVADLGGDDVHVLAAARRLDRYLPSQWQERVKAGSVLTFAAWLDVVLGDDQELWEHRNVWVAHDVVALVERWLDIVGADRLTLVIVDDSDRSQLPRAFEELLGLPAQTLTPRPGESNRGLSWPEVELVRGINAAFRRNGWSRADRLAFVNAGVLRSLTRRSDPAPGPRHAPMPGWAYDEVRRRSDLRADAVKGLPVRILGDPDQLRVPPREEEDRAALGSLSLPVGLAVDAVEAAVAVALARGTVTDDFDDLATPTDEGGDAESSQTGRSLPERVRGSAGRSSDSVDALDAL
jgi:hypothetical protein